MFEIRYWMIDRETNQAEEVMQGEIEYEGKYFNGITVVSRHSDEGVLMVDGVPGNAIHIIQASLLRLEDPTGLVDQVTLA